MPWGAVGYHVTMTDTPESLTVTRLVVNLTQRSTTELAAEAEFGQSNKTTVVNQAIQLNHIVRQRQREGWEVVFRNPHLEVEERLVML